MSLPPNKNLLEKYPNRVYVETGIWRGDSLQMAMGAGFEEMHGIDNDQSCIDFCISRFDLNRQKDTGIHLHLGDSAVCLWDAIKGIDEPITIFLDSHSQLFEDEIPSANPFPLLKELEQIGRHPIRTHTLIVDDWHIFYPDRVGYSKQDVKDAILKINPDYKFTMVANPVIDGIIVAHL